MPFLYFKLKNLDILSCLVIFRLLIVNPIKSKYSPSVGDIVIGTVLEIHNKRWKIDIFSENDSYLHLNSTYLPE